MRKWITRALIAFAVLALALWCTIRFVVDVERVRDAHDRRALDDLVALKPEDLDAVSRRIAKLHRGEGPCKYDADKKKVDDSEIEAIKRDADADGIRDRIGSVSSAFYRWATEDEVRRHGPTTDEEVVELWNMTARPFERLVALVAPHQLADAVRRKVETTERRTFARADEQLAALSERDRVAMRRLWERHRRALSFPALMDVLVRLNAAR